MDIVLPRWIFAVLGAIAAFLVAFLLHTLAVNAMEAAHEKELNTLSDTMKKSCNDAKAITERRSNELQGNYDRISADRDRLLKRPERCLQPTSPRRGDNGTGETGRAAENGISSGWLYDFAAERDKIAAQLTACQGFVNDIYRLNGQ